MIPRQWKNFIDRLLEATGNGEIKWKEGAEDAFFATQKDADLHLRSFFDHDSGEAGYNFRILRKGADAFFSVNSEEGEYGLMRNLYSAVSVNAAGGDAIVDDLFD